jgi:hypothetical protein
VAVGPQNTKFDIIEYFTMCFCVLAVGPWSTTVLIHIKSI